MDYNTFTKIYTLNENEFLLLATHHDLVYDCNYAWVYTQKKDKFDKKAKYINGNFAIEDCDERDEE
jgi:hypothetical protein